MKKEPWTDDETEFLLKYGATLDATEMSNALLEKFGIFRTTATIRTRRKMLGISSEKRSREIPDVAIDYIQQKYYESEIDLVCDCVSMFGCNPTRPKLESIRRQGERKYAERMKREKDRVLNDEKELSEESAEELATRRQIFFKNTEYARREDRRTFDLWEKEKISTREAQSRISDTNMCPVTREEFLTEAFSLGYFRKKDRLLFKVKPLKKGTMK